MGLCPVVALGDHVLGDLTMSATDPLYVRLEVTELDVAKLALEIRRQTVARLTSSTVPVEHYIPQAMALLMECRAAINALVENRPELAQ